MADQEYQQVLVLDNMSGLITSENEAAGTIVVTDATNTINTTNIEQVDVNADLLQQALQEASGFDQDEIEPAVNVEYSKSGELEENNTPQDADSIQEESDIGSIQYTSIDQVTTTSTMTTDAITSTTPAEPETEVEQPDTSTAEVGDLESSAVVISNNSTWQTEEVGPPKESDPTAIVGSAKNPIQIIQHGNTYTSTQVLSAEQLQQIAQVLQQQHLVQSATKAGSSSILYNPQTNTRIVYKVIYPSEMHTNTKEKIGVKTGDDSSTQMPVPGKRKRGRPPKQPKKTDDEDDGDKSEGVELTKAEKDEKKRKCPRTRSGRISRPPLHMVKDFKRIHTVDLDSEVYDDSDQGFSDFDLSDEEVQKRRKEGSKEPYFPSGLTTNKSRRHQCQTCDKAYIGRGGLGRHYRLNPDHGTLPPEENENEEAQPNSSVLDHSEASNLSVDSSFQPAKRGRPSKDIASIRRKNRLKEMVQPCSDEEVMEVVLPRLTKAVTLYEFLLMKAESGDVEQPSVAVIFREFETLQKQLKKLAEKSLEEASPGTEVDLSSVVKIEDKDLGKSLSLEGDAYVVKKDAPLFEYKMATDTNEEPWQAPSPEKQPVEVLLPEKERTPKDMPLLTLNGTGDATEVALVETPAQPPEVIGVISNKRPNVVVQRPQMSLLKPQISLLKPNVAPAAKLVTAASPAIPAGASSTTALATTTVTLSNNLMNISEFPQADMSGVADSEMSVAVANDADVAPPAVADEPAAIAVPSGELAAPAAPTQRLVMHNGQLFLIESSEEAAETEDETGLKLEPQDAVYEAEGEPMDEGTAIVGAGDDQHTTVDASSIQYQTEDGQLLDHNGQVIGHILQDENGQRYAQTPDGLVLLQADDQFQEEGQNIPLETVQALLAMDTESAMQVNNPI
ncbi:PREDICTED: uncharacterized protein LOC106814269 [Priapulus caudatus]|uniref:Uncharacterized protein LOC106814269 n=1 Tax=Priapulus caudatus TaxID=37621 RepID=A0ABM1EPD4_PRICU|nr:PREDICTED: uncharacterized protein LOC106814269 [Priapulus caudatus]